MVLLYFFPEVSITGITVKNIVPHSLVSFDPLDIKVDTDHGFTMKLAHLVISTTADSAHAKDSDGGTEGIQQHVIGQPVFMLKLHPEAPEPAIDSVIDVIQRCGDNKRERKCDGNHHQPLGIHPAIAYPNGGNDEAKFTVVGQVQGGQKGGSCTQFETRHQRKKQC